MRIFQSIGHHETYDNSLVNMYGGKGANLIRMKCLGLDVPQAYMLPTDWCRRYREAVDFNEDYYHGRILGKLNSGLADMIPRMEEKTGMTFGAPTKNLVSPLLVSVRSSAPVSMPGMMDTVLNVGLNDQTVRALASHTNHEFAWDSYRRFIQSFATTVLGMTKTPFEELVKTAKHFCPSGQMTVRVNQHLISKFKEMCPDFPSDVSKQLLMSTEAVFKSWMSDRATAYREIEGIDVDGGTAVIVQAMVFGNYNDRSGTGVLFSRNPVVGTGELYGDFLINAQGEDVVDGSAITMPIAAMKNAFPDQFVALETIAKKLEQELFDMVDIEFTIENEKLWILQVRKGKRSSTASKRIPLEMVADGTISVLDGIKMLNSLVLKDESTPNSTDTNGFVLAGNGLVASEGDAEGVIAFTSLDAVDMAQQGNKVILVTEKTDPGDMPGIIASVGLLTMKGGLVSHAAVVARSWDKTCIVGALAKSPHIDFHWDYLTCQWALFFENDKFVRGDSIILRTNENGAFYLKKAM